jgi:Protein of unknown function (DUF3997)
MKIKHSLLLLTSLLVTSCFGLFDNNSDRIIGKYIVLWIDLPQNQFISEERELNSSSSMGLIEEYVFAVGHNNDFIIAKQHPTSGFKNGFEIKTKITNYFIIDMNRKILKKGEKVFGPLTEIKFNELRQELKIENIEFDMNYPEKL